MSAKPVFRVPIIKSQFLETDSIRISGGSGNTRVLTCGANGFGVWVDTADILPNLTSNSVVITDAYGNLLSSNVSVVDLQAAKTVAYLFPTHQHDIANVTGLQSALSNASLVGHTHSIANINTLQTVLDGKQPTITGAATSITTANLTAQRAMTTSTGGKVTVSNVTTSELEYLSGVSSGVQAQLNNKQAAGSYANSVHVHALTDVVNLTSSLDGKANVLHTHAITNVANLQTALDLKSNVGHTHVISDVLGLSSTLASKADGVHSHVISDITGLQTSLDSKINANGAVTLNGTLHISGNTSTTFGGNSYAYFTLTGNTADTGVRNTMTPVNVSVSASGGAVQAAQFISLSDARLKYITSTPDPVDIATRCSGILPKLWKYKDALEHDGQERLGFIAQDIEAAGLEFAVTRSTRFVPTIYKLSRRSSDIAGGEGHFVCTGHGVLHGDCVQYYTARSSKPQHGKISMATKDTFELDPNPADDAIFVYGPRADDVKSIDYDALCAAAFMCIADLRRRLESLESRDT